MIRNLYPSDILYLLLQKETALTNEAGSCIFWDAQKATRCAYRPFLRQWLVPGERRFSWVYKDANRILGMISARERATPASWEIDYFLLYKKEAGAPHFREDIALALLEALTTNAGKRGVRKVFFRSYSSSPLLETVQSSHFKIYLREYLFHFENPKIKLYGYANISKLINSFELEGYMVRSRQPGDEDALYELVFKMQPPQVKNVESANFKEWHDTREKSCLREKQIVVQKGDSIQCWLGIRKGINWGHFRIIAYRGEQDTLQQTFPLAISFLKTTQNIFCTVRDYQEELKRTLEEKGFEKRDEFTLAFKEISVTEKLPVLASQQA